MTIRYPLNMPFVLVLLGAAAAADAQVQLQLAERYFKEATALCERDAGRLWGTSLCGPLVIVDQRTGTRATSQPEPDGPAPRFPGLVDGPVTWGGVRWFSIPLYMLPADDADLRQQLMLHGLFHRIQDQLGFMTEDGYNEHLDTLEGRVWMQLEWRALRRAIESSGSDRAEAIADALAFRRERRRLFPAAADNGRRDEIREGLASYTGIAAWASSPADARRAAASALSGVDAQTSLVGNFEGVSGPAYGVLLDDLLPGWRRQVRGTSDLGDLLASATDRPLTTDVAVAAARYDGAALRTAEEARDRAQQVRVAELRRRFVEGPVLTMPAAGILEAIDMDSYRAEKKATMAIALPDANAEIEPVPTSGGGRKPDPEMDKLSNIVKAFNDMYGGLFADPKRMEKRITDEIPAKVSADPAYQNAKEHSDRQNARVEHDRALRRVITALFTDDAQLFKQFQDNESFRRWLTDTVFGLTYEA